MLVLVVILTDYKVLKTMTSNVLLFICFLYFFVCLFFVVGHFKCACKNIELAVSNDPLRYIYIYIMMKRGKLLFEYSQFFLLFNLMYISIQY